MPVSETTLRVRYAETDRMGVVYYANYLRFFEGARASYWRALGRSYKDLEDAQVAMPVIEAHCNYKRPSKYEDIIAVDTHITDVRGASLRFVYEVRRPATGDELLAEGYTRHAVIGPTGRPRPLPDFMRALIV